MNKQVKTQLKKLKKEKVFMFGFCGQFEFCEKKLPENLEILFKKLNKDQVYKLSIKLLFKDRWGHVRGISLGPSFFVSADMEIKSLTKVIIERYNLYIAQYDLDVNNLWMNGIYNEWLSVDQFNLQKTDLMVKLNHVITNQLSDSTYKSLKKRIDELENKEYRDVFMNNYGSQLKKGILENGESYSLFQISPLEVVGVIFHGDTNFVYTIKGNALMKENWDKKWIDVKTPEGFYRILNNVKYYYESVNEDGFKYSHAELIYNCKSITPATIDKNHNLKIGSLDLEAFVDNNNQFIVYAGGFAIPELTFSIYAKDKNSPNKYVCDKILDKIFDLNLNNYTFYCHNLGSFDAILLINSLSNNSKYEIDGKWRPETTSLLSLTITNKLTKQKIKIHDSLQLLNNNLDKLLKSFNCKTNKGYFPYDFITYDTLFYQGRKPDIKFYHNIKKEIYDLIPLENWDAKNETLKYLQKDLEGLLEVMLIFSNQIFTKFNINITNYLTLPSLAMAVFTINFSNEITLDKIKLLPVIVQNDIRDSYYGGLSYIVQPHIKNVKKYDMNSQYPNAMLNKLPVGNPIFSTDKKLENYFGYVLAIIIPPTPNLLIQYKQDGKIIYPTTSFTRWIYSEELKESMKYGFNAKIICGYKFEVGENIFNKYINHFYFDKENASNPVTRQIAKYFLNTLYGKLGQNIPLSQIKIIKDKNLENYQLLNNIEVLGHVGNYSIFKNWGIIPENLLNALNFKNNDNSILETPESYFPSFKNSVHIASAISALARISMYKFILDVNNPIYFISTDAIVVANYLDPDLVGTKIGQMKLEEELAEAIFIYPKLYYLRTIDNKEIIKSAGIDNTQLNYNHFLDLLKGKSVEININKFELDIKTANINYTPYTIHIKKSLNEQ